MSRDVSKSSGVARCQGDDVLLLIDGLLLTMGNAERSELALLSDGRPKEALVAVIRASVYAFGYTVDGEPAAMGGVREDGVAWGVASEPLVERVKGTYVRQSLKEVQAMQRRVGGRALVTGVDQRWRKSIRLLEWFGFERHGTVGFRGRTLIILRLDNVRRAGPPLSRGDARPGVAAVMEA